MSDSFSDLWASSAPSKQHQQLPLKSLLAAANNNSNGTRRTKPDAFSMLASASSSQPSSRPITPAANTSLPPLKQNDVDAFRGLVSFGFSTARDDELTIAERAAKTESKRQEQTLGERATPKPQGSFWDQFEGDINPSLKNKTHDAWDLDFLIPEPPRSSDNQSRSSKVPDSAADWDLNFIPSAPSLEVTPPTAQPAGDIFDIDDFAALEPPRSTELSRSNTPGSFDFGDREDGDLSENEDWEADEDDILGSLAKPVEEVRRVSPKTSTGSRASQSRTSPPPHVIGRIVEMGFSIQQAKVALAATDSGVDVDGALEILLQNTRSDPGPEQEHEREHDRDEEAEAEAEKRRRRSRGPSHAMASNSGAPARPSPSLSQQQGLQDKLLSQASTIGMSMFSKANAMWKEGRDKVVKVYEEQRVLSGADTARSSGRPRWMDEAARVSDGGETSTDAVRTSDSRPSLAAMKTGPVQPTQSTSLFAEESEPAYRSPARRRSPPSVPTSTPSPPPEPPSRSPNPPSRVSTPPIARPTIAISPSALASSNVYKEAGTTHFKLGRFADADASYSSALAAVPPTHLLRVPLHNNRAMARLRTGDYKGTVEDAGEVLKIVEGDIGRAWHPGREANGAVSDGVDLGAAMGKALRRRAEANEGMERWGEAGRDWERLSAVGWVGSAVREEAVKGAGRCRRMLKGTSGSATSSRPAVRPRPAPRSVASRPSEALSRVRDANAAQEAEDQARHDLKDSVDGRLESWRNGKELNLRALIASLDVVLWPELGWQKVGMAELVSPAQVKVRYTRAIGKVHPDKLHVGNTTLEQRMIANGVFGTLNEAWNAFR